MLLLLKVSFQPIYINKSGKSEHSIILRYELLTGRKLIGKLWENWVKGSLKSFSFCDTGQTDMYV